MMKLPSSQVSLTPGLKDLTPLPSDLCQVSFLCPTRFMPKNQLPDFEYQ
jgi:hypothetical protein